MKYQVRFFYYTDLRCDWIGEAMNDIIALALAMEAKNITMWCTSVGYRIEIEQIKWSPTNQCWLAHEMC